MRFFPEVRLRVWHAMLLIAALAVSLALAREHLTLGVVTGCVLVLTIRTVVLAQRQRQEGEEVTKGRRVGWFLGSLCCSLAIIGASCLTFMFVSILASQPMRSKETHARPEVIPPAVVLGGLAGLGSGYGIRLWLWEPRNRRDGSKTTTNPRP